MQYPLHYTSKEDIRARLLQSAADFWGIRSAADLDPMVRLLIEALSGELYNLVNDLRNTENRLLNKLAALLTPDMLTTPLPAHALAQAFPADAAELLADNKHFVYSPRRQAGTDRSQEVFFTPAVPVEIYDARILYTATGNRFYQHDAQRGKVLQAMSTGRYLPPHTLWIGLRPHPGIQQMEHFTCYFNWPHFAFDHEWYKLLALCECSINGQAVSLKSGFPYDPESIQPENSILNKTLAFDTMPVIIRDVLEYYHDHYLSFSFHPPEHEQQRYPAAFEDVFSTQDLSKLQEPVIWLRLTFPAAIQQPLLDNIEVYTNAFPVVNRRLHKLKHRFKGVGNIIPVKPETHEFFLSVQQLTDSHGKHYHPISYNEHETQGQDAYSVRLGGAERFDSRNARELINYLFELLRDESAAFSAYGYDFLTDVLQNLQQNIALVEQKSRHSLTDMTESTRYVIVRPQHPVEVMYLDYWTTQSEAAHQLRSGLPLMQFEGSGVRAESLQLLTRPSGGRKAAEQNNLLQAYKYALMTRDRIVTEDDIRNFCIYELGAKATGIAIKRGVIASPHPNEGLKKTTDIYITQAPDHSYTSEEWELTHRQLLQKLKTRSSILTHYRIILQQAG
ncbi:hypothetical protein AAHN97_15490 [Chitinophaga niabensis]|uniref:hypothetical protein n=1 Tax=Chitinophaga niabensis TaxID=536979 RepID=UPI0031BB50CE